MTTVLLAEDEPDNADLIMRGLRRRGFEVLHAENGALAVEMARDKKPDVIVMDKNMHVMNGVDATRAIRQDPITRDIGVIMLSADKFGVEEQAIECGCDDVDEKPIDGDRLAEKIKTVLVKRGQQDA